MTAQRWRTFSVQLGLVPSLFADIDVNPSLPVDGVYLSEDMVFGIPYPSDSGSNSPAKHAEAVGPFATSASAGLEQHKGVVVSRVALVLTTVLERALVEFDLVGAAGLFVRERGGHVKAYGGRAAS